MYFKLESALPIKQGLAILNKNNKTGTFKDANFEK
jgi:hypothetical protein